MLRFRVTAHLKEEPSQGGSCFRITRFSKKRSCPLMLKHKFVQDAVWCDTVIVWSLFPARHGRWINICTDGWCTHDVWPWRRRRICCTSCLRGSVSWSLNSKQQTSVAPIGAWNKVQHSRERCECKENSDNRPGRQNPDDVAENPETYVWWRAVSGHVLH